MRKIIILAAAVLLTVQTQAQIKRDQPKPGPAPTVQVTKPKEFTMPNGLKVMVVEDHKLPRVSYTLTIDTPPYSEGDKVGVAALTSAVVGNGTTKTSKDKFNDEIDFLGARINFWNTGASGSGLSKYSDRILELLAEGALNPLFTQEEFDKAKAQALEGLKAEEKSTSAIASRLENALLYGLNHPNGEFETEQSINKITLNDVKQNYTSYFVPEQAYLVIIGDVNFDKVKAKVEKLFSGWAKASAPVTTYPAAKNVAKTQIDFVNVPNAVQSEISLVNLVDLKMTDKDYFAVIMANQILGGGGEGRLFLNLREAHGWTYGAYSSISASKYTTKFKSQASVRNAVTDSAVMEFRNELNNIRQKPATEEELKLAKAKYIGNFVMETQKPATIAMFALRTKTQNLPSNFYENFIKNINAVTLKDVQEAAQKYFMADNMRIVIAGKGSEVLPGLEKLGYAINYYDAYGQPTTKPMGAKPVPAGVTAQTVLEANVKAIGGENNLKKVKSVATTAEATMQGMKITFVQKQTNKMQQMVSLSASGMELMKQVITPKMGYASGQGQKQELKGEELANAQKGAVLFEELEDLKAASTFQLSGIETFEGVDAYVLTKDKSTTYYSVASGLKLGKMEVIEAQGQEHQMITVFKDYKEVKGVKFPYSFTVPVLGNAEFTVTSIKVNEGVSDADFK